jgi:phage baseplate assembly protein W
MAKIKRSTTSFSDLDLMFSRNPNTNDVGRKLDVEAVKSSLRHLILTSTYERPFHPEIGGNIHALLFENDTPQTRRMLEQSIRTTVLNHEPRAQLSNVIVTPNPDSNEYTITIYFYVVSINEEQVFTTYLQRLR